MVPVFHISSREIKKGRRDACTHNVLTYLVPCAGYPRGTRPIGRVWAGSEAYLFIVPSAGQALRRPPPENLLYFRYFAAAVRAASPINRLSLTFNTMAVELFSAVLTTTMLPMRSEGISNFSLLFNGFRTFAFSL